MGRKRWKNGLRGKRLKKQSGNNLAKFWDDNCSSSRLICMMGIWQEDYISEVKVKPFKNLKKVNLIFK